MKKSINVNESSIVDLKAELFRKEEKFKQDKTSSLGKDLEKQKSKGSKTLEKLAVLTGKRKNAPKRERDISIPEKVESVNSEDNSQYEKSKTILQAKARLYDKMTSGEVEDPEDDEESFYLVDFHKKLYSKEANSCHDMNSTSGDDWVEFEDSLGRTRKCMKKDLETFKALDQEFRPKERTPSPTALSSEDVRREMMRKKWEAEQEELSRSLERDIHYQNVLFDEVREHGVAYYQFSKDESERKSQMETLNQLREQTVNQRAKREQIKAKRQAALNARLAKIKQKKLKAKDGDEGCGDAGTNSEVLANEERTEDIARPSTSNNSADVGATDSESILENSEADSQVSNTCSLSSPYQNNEPTEKDTNNFPAKKSVVDGKSSYATWLKAFREERNEDFAPPSFYYDTEPKVMRKNDKETGKIHLS